MAVRECNVTATSARDSFCCCPALWGHLRSFPAAVLIPSMTHRPARRLDSLPRSVTSPAPVRRGNGGLVVEQVLLATCGMVQSSDGSRQLYLHSPAFQLVQLHTDVSGGGPKVSHSVTRSVISRCWRFAGWCCGYEALRCSCGLLMFITYHSRLSDDCLRLPRDSQSVANQVQIAGNQSRFWQRRVVVAHRKRFNAVE